MKLKKVISGGQTGADRAGLECAKNRGIETGGTAPRGYRTEDGPDPTLKAFGLTEDASSAYPPRTRKNVLNSDCTIWYGNTTSAGFRCTEGAAKHHSKPFYIYGIHPNHSIGVLSRLFETINIAGNRKSTNPAVCEMVRKDFETLKENS